MVYGESRLCVVTKIKIFSHSSELITQSIKILSYDQFYIILIDIEGAPDEEIFDLKKKLFQVQV